MALARLLYEFAPVLAGLVPDLLPAVLLLLRSKAREVIKSVLGFVKVRAAGGGLWRPMIWPLHLFLCRGGCSKAGLSRWVLQGCFWWR